MNLAAHTARDMVLYIGPTAYDLRRPASYLLRAAVNRGITCLSLGLSQRAVAEEMHADGVPFSVAWRVILFPNARRKP